MAIQRRPARSRAGGLLLPPLGAVLVLGVLAISKWKGAWVSQRAGAQLQGHASQGMGSGGSSSSSSSSLGSSRTGSGKAGSSSGDVKQVGEQQLRQPVAPEIEQRCQLAVGSWCTEYYMQAEVPGRMAPRGNKTCSLNCNQVGVCSALSGLCSCPAGWTGFNCLHPMKRHCTHKYRDWGFEPPKLAPNFTESNGPHAPNRFQNTVSHCAGDCDDDVAACWCPANTTYGRIPAPIDAPPGAPPTRRGRPLPQYCQPNSTADGTQTGWGFVDYQDVFGPEGWCMAARPRIKCECYLDGLGGELCDQSYEQFCLNQCNGRGECLHGYCKCDPGWHGIDCAHQSAFADASQPGREAQRPWTAEHVHTPAARDFPPGATRKRPLIFVYELPGDFATLMLQYRRAGGGSCTARMYNDANDTLLSLSLYNLESGFVEALLQSGHRTLDPEEADYFYVPVLTSCWIEHVRWACCLHA
ncbi:hypothetical protein ABPG75_008195 [Micractinium tetrahymenae]